MIVIIAIISLSILILVHELGHFLAAKIFGVRVDEFGIGFPPRIFGKKIGNTIYSVNALPFGGFVKIFGEDGEDNAEKSHEIFPHRQNFSFASQTFTKKSAIILAGVFMNIVLGWLVLSSVFMIGASQHLMISGVQTDSPAQNAGLQESDIILSAAFSGQILADPIKTDDFVNLVKTAGEKKIELKIKRGKETLETAISGRLNPPSGQGSLGLNLAEIGFGREPLFKSFIKGFEASWFALKIVAVGFADFISKIFVSPKVIETVTGPVGIFTIAAKSGELGIIYVFELMAFISLNLAVLNFLPFPALDGGRFLFLLIEKIKGSPLPKKFQLIVNAIGFAALILLMILVTVQDVGKLIK